MSQAESESSFSVAPRKRQREQDWYVEIDHLPYSWEQPDQQHRFKDMMSMKGSTVLDSELWREIGYHTKGWARFATKEEAKSVAAELMDEYPPDSDWPIQLEPKVKSAPKRLPPSKRFCSERQ